MSSILLRGGTVINADQAFKADVLTQDGKIVAVGIMPCNSELKALNGIKSKALISAKHR